MMKHQDAFDALSTAPVLRYPGFCREFILEKDASLNGLGAILSQQGTDRKIHVITHASHFLCPSERSMCNYSLAKLELLVLKWAVMGEILGLFVRVTIPSLHGQQSTHLCPRKQIRCTTNPMP